MIFYKKKIHFILKYTDGQLSIIDWKWKQRMKRIRLNNSCAPFINSLHITVNHFLFKATLFRNRLEKNWIAETNTVRTRFGDKVVTKNFFPRTKVYMYNKNKAKMNYWIDRYHVLFYSAICLDDRLI